MNGQAARGLFSSARLAQTNQGTGAKAWPGGVGCGGLGFSQLSSALWASFLLALRQKVLVNYAGSVPSLGVLRAAAGGPGTESLPELRTARLALRALWLNGPVRHLWTFQGLDEAGAWRQRRRLSAVQGRGYTSGRAEGCRTWVPSPALLLPVCHLGQVRTPSIQWGLATPPSEGCCEVVTTDAGDKVPYT